MLKRRSHIFYDKIAKRWIFLESSRHISKRLTLFVLRGPNRPLSTKSSNFLYLKWVYRSNVSWELIRYCYNEFYISTLSKYGQSTMHCDSFLKRFEIVEGAALAPLTFITAILLLKCTQLPQYSPKTSKRVPLWRSIIELADISFRGHVLWCLPSDIVKWLRRGAFR